jgi:hypothetical protein
MPGTTCEELEFLIGIGVQMYYILYYNYLPLCLHDNFCKAQYNPIQHYKGNSTAGFDGWIVYRVVNIVPEAQRAQPEYA